MFLEVLQVLYYKSRYVIILLIIYEMTGGWRGIYATIPIFSALINMVTNKLAVWMIFSPLDFKGNYKQQMLLHRLNVDAIV